MATSAVARETILSLRRTIAKIEGVLPERLETPAAAPMVAGVILRESGLAVKSKLSSTLRTGAEHLDAALGGGLPDAALTEIHGPDPRDAGAAAGFALGMAGLARRRHAERPVLWIGAGEAFSEAGFPYAPGLLAFCGLSPGDLLVCDIRKLADALWIAEEAARLSELSAVFLEVRGNPRILDLTATRRLHRRAQIAGRPVFLLRQSAGAEPTAAPFRLLVSAAPATPRSTVAGPLPGSIGQAAYAVTLDKSRSALAGQFVLEWNPHELAFQERRPEDPGSMVPASQRRARPASASGTVLAFRPSEIQAAARLQPSREQHPAHRRPRRTG
ncbi:ImuA family protein [Mesorhizobium sp. 1B3]|uniref:ImuA family protein n=1 Tax=Mesorhizobium sp. 1B3 TaxID=3243599 RepID=UPI003D97502F